MKVGDRVIRIRRSHEGINVGDVSFVRALVGHNSEYMKLEGFLYFHKISNYKVVNILDSKLARRLYPDYVKEGIYLVPKIGEL